jgi:hypothetical protein
MGIFDRLQGRLTATAGGVQSLAPLGWVLNGSGYNLTRNDQAYSAAITPDLALGNWIVITATNGAAFTINAPLVNGAALTVANAPVGLPIVLSLLNNSGGALGAVTLNAIYKGNSGFTAGINNLNSISALMLMLSSTQILGIGPWTGQFAF